MGSYIEIVELILSSQVLRLVKREFSAHWRPRFYDTPLLAETFGDGSVGRSLRNSRDYPFRHQSDAGSLAELRLP